MKLSYNALEKLKRLPNYSVKEDNENVIITYYTPSIAEASGNEENDYSRIIQITGKKLDNYIEIERAEIRTEDNRLLREMSLEELELWIQYLEW